jgi:transcription elongation GreA/GreB family factor
MSKAFLRESDFEIPEAPVLRAVPTAPMGGRLSFTPDGMARLQEELRRLSEIERPHLVSTGSMGIGQRTALQTLDQRIHQLSESLRAAEVVSSPVGEIDRVCFGAYVTVREGKKVEARYRIVGAAETELEADWISWESPLGRALLNRRRGEDVVFAAPRGETRLTIVDVKYV